MKKNFKVITINGVRGIFAAIFVVLGLIAGFIISPGWVCMQLWNYIFEDSTTVAMMNIYQGIMLWAIIALSLYALNNKRSLIGFGAYQGLSPDQIKDIMNRAKESENRIIKELETMAKEKSLKEGQESITEVKKDETEEACEKEEVRK